MTRINFLVKIKANCHNVESLLVVHQTHFHTQTTFPASSAVRCCEGPEFGPVEGEKK